MRLLDRIFRLEEINGDGACEVYMYRWTLLSLGKRFKLYLHHFIRDDWSRDMHDHPKRFVSIGLKGRYIEQTPAGDREFQAPWVRTFPPTHIHRLRLYPGETTWTMVAVFRPVREWGFWHKGKWIDWRTYVGSREADEAMDC